MDTITAAELALLLSVCSINVADVKRQDVEAIIRAEATKHVHAWSGGIYTSNPPTHTGIVLQQMRESAARYVDPRDAAFRYLNPVCG